MGDGEERRQAQGRSVWRAVVLIWWLACGRGARCYLLQGEEVLGWGALTAQRRHSDSL